MKHFLKAFLTASLCIFIFSAKVYSLGAGIQLGAVPGILINQDDIKFEELTANITGTFKLERLPVTAGTGLEFGKLYSDFNYGFSAFADYRAIDIQIVNTWSLYSGFGASAKFLTDDFKDWSLAAGARFFAGVNTLFYDGYLELYAQQNIVPTYLKSLNQADSSAVFMLCLPLEAGIRMHF